MSKLQANVPVSNLQYFQLPKSSNPVDPPAAETIQTLFIFNKTRFLYILENYSLSNKFLVFFIKAWSLLHQGKKRTTVEDNVSEDGNIQLHEEIIDTIIEKR